MESMEEVVPPVLDGWGQMKAMEEEVVPPVPGEFLLRLGEFQSVADDLDSLLFMTESTCLGRLTADAEQLPGETQTMPETREGSQHVLKQPSWRSRGKRQQRQTVDTRHLFFHLDQ